MENKEQQYKNLTLISINNTLHIKADNLEPVEVDSSCVDGILLSIDHKIPQFSLSEGINISELSDRIEVRDTEIDVNERKELFHKMHPNKTVADFAHKKGQTTNSIQSQFHNIFDEANVPTNKLKAFLLPEKEDKCDGKCVPNECLCEWEDMTKEQVKAEALPSITEKYGKSFEKSYTIEEIEKAINGVKLVPHYDEILKIIKKQILNNLKKLTNTY